MTPRLKELYYKEIQSALKSKFGFKNLYMGPKIEKIEGNWEKNRSIILKLTPTRVLPLLQDKGRLLQEENSGAD